MHRKGWPAFAGVVATVSLTLLIAACGGDGEDGSHAAPTATEVAATAPADQTPNQAAPTATEVATTGPAGQTPNQAAPAATEVATTEPTGQTRTQAAPTATEAAATEPVGQTPDGRVIVDVPHWEWEISISPDTAPAGTVTFNAINEGTLSHNLRLVKTELAPDALPVDDSTFLVDEDQLEILAVSRDLDAGESEELTVELEPGSYVLFCNIFAHYQTGLYIGFSVE